MKKKTKGRLSKEVRVYLRMSAPMFKEIVGMAQREMRSISNMVFVLLQEALDQRAKGGG